MIGSRSRSNWCARVDEWCRLWGRWMKPRSKGGGLTGRNVGRASLERLAELTQLVEDGVLRLPSVRDYPLEKAGDALEEHASRHVKGKLVLIV